MKIELRKYIVQATLIFAVLLALGMGILALFQKNSLRLDVGVGIFLGYVNTIIGYVILAWGMKRSQNAFMGAVFGGMIFRFLLLFSILFILIIAVHFQMIPLIISLLFSYFSFLFFEIMFVNKYTTQSK